MIWMRVLAVSVLFGAAALVGPGQALAQSADGPLGCGIVWEAEIEYTIMPGDDAVTVESINTLTYPEDAAAGCSTDTIAVPVPPATFDLHAESPTGSTLNASIEQSSKAGYSALAFVSLPDRLNPGEIDGFSVSYVMPEDGEFTSVSSDEASFVPWVWGSSGSVSLTVVTGSGDTAVIDTPEQLHPGTGASGTYAIDAIANPEEWSGLVAVYRDAQRSASTVNASGYPVVIHAIGSDHAWEQNVGTDLSSGIPALERLVGLPWPDSKPLDVIEVGDESLNGYAGLYRSGLHVIEVPEELSQSLMLHELGHAWFNDGIFADAWMSEGLADAYAFVAESAIADTDGLDPSAAEYVGADSTGSVPLASWEAADVVDEGSKATVDFGYSASYWVMSEVMDEIGADAMSATVVAAAEEAAIAGEPVTSVRFLELFEEVGGSQEARELFAVYGAVDGVGSESATPAPVSPQADGPIVAVVTPRVSPLALALTLLPLAILFTLIYRSRRATGRTISVAAVPFDSDRFDQWGSAPGVPLSPSNRVDWVDGETRHEGYPNAEPWVY